MDCFKDDKTANLFLEINPNIDEIAKESVDMKADAPLQDKQTVVKQDKYSHEDVFTEAPKKSKPKPKPKPKPTKQKMKQEQHTEQNSEPKNEVISEQPEAEVGQMGQVGHNEQSWNPSKWGKWAGQVEKVIHNEQSWNPGKWGKLAGQVGQVGHNEQSRNPGKWVGQVGQLG